MAVCDDATPGEYESSGCVQGYHVYGDIWSAAVGEQLICKREVDNSSEQ